MTKDETLELCKPVAAKYKLDPLLLCAIAEQESSFNPSELRLENDFYRRYTRPMSFAPSTEALLAISYGLMQTMGESLRELGLINAEDPDAVRRFIDAYVIDPPFQVDCGARWFTRKLKLAGGDIRKALLYWNGGSNKKYDAEVLARRDRMKTEATK